MADPQRIHPIHHDPESRPTAPLFPGGATSSDKGDPATPPPFRRTLPAGHSRPPKRQRSCLCRCLCWTLSLLVLLILILAAIVGIMFLVFRPKVPKFSIDGMRITQFTLGNSDTLSATFSVNMTSHNPNAKIGIFYESGSHVSAWYRGGKLSQGSLPEFYQGHRNTTVLDLTMTGQSSNARALIAALQQDQQTTGMIPLDLRVDQPVRIKLGALKLPKFKFTARCNLEVDNLTASTAVRIRSSTCKFRLRL